MLDSYSDSTDNLSLLVITVCTVMLHVRCKHQQSRCPCNIRTADVETTHDFMLWALCNTNYILWVGRLTFCVRHMCAYHVLDDLVHVMSLLKSCNTVLHLIHVHL